MRRRLYAVLGFPSRSFLRLVRSRTPLNQLNVIAREDLVGGFDLVALRDEVIWNVQCENNLIDLQRVEAEASLFARYNQGLVSSYERARTKERNREDILKAKLARDTIRHMVASRFPVVTLNPRILPFSRIGTFGAPANALLAASPPGVKALNHPVADARRAYSFAQAYALGEANLLVMMEPAKIGPFKAEALKNDTNDDLPRPNRVVKGAWRQIPDLVRHAPMNDDVALLNDRLQPAVRQVADDNSAGGQQSLDLFLKGTPVKLKNLTVDFARNVQRAEKSAEFTCNGSKAFGSM